MMLIVFAVLGVVGVSLARQEARSQVRATSREVAFYAAEAGLARGLRKWTVPDTLVPAGTRWLLDSGTLPGGASYRTGVIKLGDGSSIHSLFAVRTEGIARDGFVQHAGLLVHTRPLENPFKAALEDKREGGAKVKGNPPLEEDPDTANFFDLGDITFDELAADADIVLADGKVMEGKNPEPSYNADGTCNTLDPDNWGDPENPGQPCANWFPTIYAKGDLHLKAKQVGQGLLLVEGNLVAEGGFVFYGPVIVKGELVALGGFTFYGGVKAGETDLGAGNAEIYYSACVLQRVLSNTAAARPRLLMERPWFRNR
jgi:hypothetical protein